MELARSLAESLDKEISIGLAARLQEALRDLGIGTAAVSSGPSAFEELKKAMEEA